MDATVVSQSYQTDVNVEHVIKGNSVVIKCTVPSFVADHVTVDAWLVDGDIVHADFSAGISIRSENSADDDVSLEKRQRYVARQFIVAKTEVRRTTYLCRLKLSFVRCTDDDDGFFEID